jgi:hypothetical protein
MKMQFNLGDLNLIKDENGNEVIVPVEDRGYEEVIPFDVVVRGKIVGSTNLTGKPNIGQYITDQCLNTDYAYKIDKVEKIKIHVSPSHKSRAVQEYWKIN